MDDEAETEEEEVEPDEPEPEGEAVKEAKAVAVEETSKRVKEMEIFGTVIPHACPVTERTQPTRIPGHTNTRTRRSPLPT